MNTPEPDVVVVGGGLAGSEAAYQVAIRGKSVWLYEMRPLLQTGAHVSDKLGELICSNSLGSRLPDRAAGLLQNELRLLGSLLIHCADQTALPAGDALAVDRNEFSSMVTSIIESHPNIRLIREEVKEIPDRLCIIASGPLTSSALSASIMKFTGRDHLFFFDAIAPIVYRDSIDMKIAFRASRYKKGVEEQGDYINCPFTSEEYARFVNAILTAERISLKGFEEAVISGVNAGAQRYFESCLPIEILASRGKNTLAYGPMRPTGLVDPRTGTRPYAVVQLRQDNLAATLYNLVGFQTNIKFPEQDRIFRMIPGLAEAEFARYGQMHRNTFLFSPGLLNSSLQAKTRPDIFFAGQITGVEGYSGNIATGLLAGVNAVLFLEGKELWDLPKTTMVGALCEYITHASERDFQPMKANFGLLPDLNGNEYPQKGRAGRRERARYFVMRAHADMLDYLAEQGFEVKV